MTSTYPDNPPQLGGIPTLDDAQYPNQQYPNQQSSSNETANAQSAKDSFASSAQSALNSVTNHPVTQDVKNTVSNGPVGQSVQNQYANTASEFQNLANSRTRPSEKTATGQQLTHYHSMFYNLLSWENPRATAIAFTLNVALIFAARYLDAVRYFLKLTFMVLGATGSAEVLGKTVFSNGFVSQLRPRQYYTLPKEAIDRVLDDFHELLNFFVIESQRILFAENVAKTVAAALSALTAFLLYKIVPFWGLSLIGTSVLYLVPLVYVNNRETIDDLLRQSSDVMGKQAHQIKQVAGHHTTRASEQVKAYAGDASNKAQSYMGSAKQRVNSATQNVTQHNGPTSGSRNTSSSYNTSDFPSAPQTNITDSVRSTAADVNQSAGQTFKGRDEPLLA